MGSDFSGEDLINTAIGIERRGIMFYDVMAMSTDDEQARSIFEGLAAMERVHQETFERMLQEHDFRPFEDYEQAGYLQSLIDDAVFTDDLITGNLAEQADSDVQALELAISAEKDSILFYYEFRDLLPDNLAPIINDILIEEKRHLEQLTVIKKSLS